MNSLEFTSVLWAIAFGALFILVGVFALRMGYEEQREREKQEREQ